MEEEEIWRDTMAKVILKLHDSNGEAQGQASETILRGALASSAEVLQSQSTKILDEVSEEEVKRGAADAGKSMETKVNGPDFLDKDTSTVVPCDAPNREAQKQREVGLDPECLELRELRIPAVEVAMSAVALAQAAAERQCSKAIAAEKEAALKESVALAKTSEAAEEVARAQAIFMEAQHASAVATASLKATEEQVEVKAQMRKAELEESLVSMEKQHEMKAQAAAEGRLRDHEQALEKALRAAERRVQNRLLDADALAASAEERAKARVKAAEEEADAAVRLAQKRVLAAEVACNVRIRGGDLLEGDMDLPAWTSLLTELPLGLEERMFAVETLLQSQKVGESGGGFLAADALKRAREAHGKVESAGRLSPPQPLAAAFVVTWGILLAIALDAILQLLLSCGNEPHELLKSVPTALAPKGDMACAKQKLAGHIEKTSETSHLRRPAEPLADSRQLQRFSKLPQQPTEDRDRQECKTDLGEQLEQLEESGYPSLPDVGHKTPEVSRLDATATDLQLCQHRVSHFSTSTGQCEVVSSGRSKVLT